MKINVGYFNKKWLSGTHNVIFLSNGLSGVFVINTIIDNPKEALQWAIDLLNPKKVIYNISDNVDMVL